MKQTTIQLTDEQVQRKAFCLALAQLLSEEVESMYDDKYFRQAAKQAAKNTASLLRNVLDYRYHRTDHPDGVPLIKYGNSNEGLAAMRSTIHKAFVFDYNVKCLSDEDHQAFAAEQEVLLQKFNLLKAIP